MRNYPWMLYRGDEFRVVNDASEEAQAKADGFVRRGTVPAVAPVPPVPPPAPIVEAESIVEPAPSARTTPKPRGRPRKTRG